MALVGRNGIEELLDRVPEAARDCVSALGSQLRMLKAQISEFDRRIMAAPKFSGGLAQCRVQG